MHGEGFRRGLRLFNSGEFYEAHEVLEDVWRAAPVAEKKFIQGVIQLAVAFHHHSTGNVVGALSLLKRGSRNLSRYPNDFAGLRLPELLASTSNWQHALQSGGPLPPLPCIELTDARIGFPMSQQPVTKAASYAASGRKMDPVPLLDLSRQYAAIRDEVLAAVERVCSSQHFILGGEVEALEQEMAAFTGAAAAVGCGSGTDALWLALLAIGIQPGDAVVTTAFSFFASASAIVRAGARPILVDVDPLSLNLDHGRVESLLRECKGYKIRALLPVHLYGQCADMDGLERIAQEFRIPIIEDAAQAIGAKWRERNAGAMGAAAAFSFYPTKNLSAYGDAGLVTTNNPEFAEHMRRLRNHGSPRRYLHQEIGWNSRLDAIQAAILRVKLPHIEQWNTQRRERAATYERLITKAGLSANKGPVQPLRTSPNAYHVFHQYVIRAHRRDELRTFLSERGIGTEIYYPLPLHLQPSLSYLGYGEGDLPESELAAREVLALPMFPELTSQEQEWIVESIAEFYS